MPHMVNLMHRCWIKVLIYFKKLLNSENLTDSKRLKYMSADITAEYQ